MKKLMFLVLALTVSCFVQAEIVDGIPTDNLIAWYDASDIDAGTYVDENDIITTWPNKVAGGIDLEIFSGTMYYEASNALFNNLPCIDQITGVGIMRASGLTDMLDGKTFTIFTVVDSTGGTGPGFTNNAGGGRLYGRGHQFYVGDPAIDAIPPTLVTTPSIRVYKLDADYDEGTDTYSNGYISMQINNDSSNKATNSTVSQGSVITFGNGYFQIPYTAGGGNYGKYAEIIIYDRALTAVEENAVGYYLAQKYNISTFFVPPSICTLSMSTCVQVDLVDEIPEDNLIAWYDADDIDAETYVDENDVITTWPNKIAGGIDLEISSGTMYYEASNAVFNNRACIDQITGVGIMRASGLTDMLDGKTFTLFTVVDSTGGTGPGFTNNGGGNRLYGRGHQFIVGDPALYAVPPTLVYTPSVRVYKLDADYDESTDTYSNGYIQLTINDDSANTAVTSTAEQGSVITFGNGYFQIPYTAGGGNYGKYAEIIIYDRALTDFEENIVGYYLAQKYNISTFFVSPAMYPSFVDTVTPSVGTHKYLPNEVVNLSATMYRACPDIYEFTDWNGNVTDSYSAETSITMDSDKTVVANYSLSSIQCLTLTIETSPTGFGTTSPAVGSYGFAPGEVVLLDAIVDDVNCPYVYEFANWDGDGVDNPLSASTTVEVTTNQTVTAVYLDARTCGDVCHPYPDSDFNYDCIVNLDDFIIGIAEWLECTAPECD